MGGTRKLPTLLECTHSYEGCLDHMLDKFTEGSHLKKFRDATYNIAVRFEDIKVKNNEKLAELEQHIKELKNYKSIRNTFEKIKNKSPVTQEEQQSLTACMKKNPEMFFTVHDKISVIANVRRVKDYILQYSTATNTNKFNF